MVQDVVVELEEQDLGVVPMPRGEWLLIRGDPQDSGALGGVGRDSRRLGAIGRGFSIPRVVVALLGREARLLEGRFGSNSCNAFRFLLLFAWAERQEVQVANTLPDAFVGKQDSGSFRMHPEQYLESIFE
jgi:hypothetical protein